jgi:uncharacterized RDD family membrane protein YckC
MDEVLDEIEIIDNSDRNFKAAAKIKRFINYVIDTIVYYIFIIAMGFLYGVFSSLFASDSSSLTNSSNEDLWFLFLTVFSILGYYTFFEYFLQGKTVGKYVTKTRAVRLNNQRLLFKDALIRSLCRFIPFEAFSFLISGEGGLHDGIAKTRVIEDVNWKIISA